MQLYLEILDGDQAGMRIPIREGLVIGRKGVDVTLRDSKVSSRHAEVKQVDENWFLVDLGSANGIKTEAGRVRELPLVMGASFIIGQTSLKVTVANKETVSTSRHDKAEDEPSVPLRPQWLETLLRLAREARALEPKSSDVAHFSPLLKLKFTRGIQMGTEWLLGYGPRNIGAHSVDLALDEPGAPAVCFSLLPQHKGILFKTDHSDYVRLNGRSIDSEFLRDGDQIHIKNTQIDVVFEYDE